MKTAIRADCLGLGIRSSVLQWPSALGSRSLPGTRSLIIDNWNLAPKPRFGRSMYLPLYVRKHRPMYRQQCPALRRELRGPARRQLRRALRHRLREQLLADLLVELHATLLKTLLETKLAALLGSLLDSRQGSLQAPKRPALRRQGLQGRRPPGQGVGGRIVVENCPTTTYRRVPTAMAAHIFRPFCPA
jgi:hypothetical protein